MKLTVKEYATQLDISIQSVYKRIQRGSIQSIKVDGTIYVLTEDKEVESDVQSVQSMDYPLLDMIRQKDKTIKRKDKEIKRLTIKLEECNSKKEEVYLSYIAEQKHQKIMQIEFEKNKVPGIKTFWRNLWKGDNHK